MKSIPFRIVTSPKDVFEGMELMFDDHSTGIITKIKSVKFISNTRMEVIGLSKPTDKIYH